MRVTRGVERQLGCVQPAGRVLWGEEDATELRLYSKIFYPSSFISAMRASPSRRLCLALPDLLPWRHRPPGLELP